MFSLIKELKKIICYTAIFLFILSLPLKAAFEFKEGGVRAAALAGAYTAAADDVEAVFWNPAGLRFCDGIQVNTTYTNLYGLSDLKYMNFNFIMPTLTAGTWGIGYTSFGPSDYRETDLRLSFASGLGSGVYMGANLKSNRVKIGNGGGSAGALGVDLGFTANVSPRFRMGFTAINVNSPALGDTSEMPERRFMAGFLLKPFDGVRASFDISKPLKEELETRAGVEFGISEALDLRAGVQTIPARFTFGFGLNWSVFTFNYAFLNHTVLNTQHLFSLQMKMNRKERERVSFEKTKGKNFTGVVNINTAGPEELAKLPGIGKITAKKIVEYREKSGDFITPGEIMNIYGFSKTKFDKIKDHITVGKIKKRPKKRVPLEEVRETEKHEDIDVQPEPVPEEIPEKTSATREEQPEEIPVPKAEKEEISKQQLAEKENINTANVKKLSSVDGVTAGLARNIVRFRKARGNFRNWDELLRVPGVNRRILENIKKEFLLK